MPNHRTEDGPFRSAERIKKPNRGAKYFIDVIFDAPDAHIRLNHNCKWPASPGRRSNRRP